MAVVDTSFLVALHDRRDLFHQEAQRTPLSGQRLLVPCEVWQEFSQVTMRTWPPEEAKKRLADARAGPFDIRHATSPDDLPHWVGAARPVQQHLEKLGRKPMTLVDFVVCRLAQRLREAVLTFDEGMGEALANHVFPGARRG